MGWRELKKGCSWKALLLVVVVARWLSENHIKDRGRSLLAAWAHCLNQIIVRTSYSFYQFEF